MPTFTVNVPLVAPAFERVIEAANAEEAEAIALDGIGKRSYCDLEDDERWEFFENDSDFSALDMDGVTVTEDVVKEEAAQDERTLEDFFFKD